MQVFTATLNQMLVLGVFGEKVLFDYMIFTLPLNLYVYSIGTASLIPTEKGGKLSVKTFVNPIFIALILGAVCGLLSVPLPKFITTAISSAGACMSPLAMLLTGFVIGEYSLKTLASDKKVYLASVIRLIILPSAFMAVLLLLKTDKDIIRVALCATAMPLGLNTVVFPAAYGGRGNGACFSLDFGYYNTRNVFNFYLGGKYFEIPTRHRLRRRSVKSNAYR